MVHEAYRRQGAALITSALRVAYQRQSRTECGSGPGNGSASSVLKYKDRGVRPGLVDKRHQRFIKNSPTIFKFDRLNPASIRTVHRVSEEDVMITIASIFVACFIAFGVMAETAPTLDYMADDR
jgi:hypothetical protein